MASDAAPFEDDDVVNGLGAKLNTTFTSVSTQLK